jgi:hypothetical protein
MEPFIHSAAKVVARVLTPEECKTFTRAIQRYAYRPRNTLLSQSKSIGTPKAADGQA